MSNRRKSEYQIVEGKVLTRLKTKTDRHVAQGLQSLGLNRKDARARARTKELRAMSLDPEDKRQRA